MAVREKTGEAETLSEALLALRDELTLLEQQDVQQAAKDMARRV